MNINELRPIHAHLEKFEKRTGCFVEYATIFGSSQRGYGLENSDIDIGFVFDHPKPTTLTLKDNIKFKVGEVEFIGTSRAFFLDKLGSSSTHHWLVLLGSSIVLSGPYSKFFEGFVSSVAMRQHIARRFIQSGLGQLHSTEHNLGKAFGEQERAFAIHANLATFEDDDAFSAAIKHNLQAIYTIARGLAIASNQNLFCQDITELLGMTEFGRQIMPDVRRLISLRRSDIERSCFNSKNGWALAEWSEAVGKYALELPIFMYEGSNSPSSGAYDPQEDTAFNIHQGSDNPIRRLIVEHFFQKDKP